MLNSPFSPLETTQFDSLTSGESFSSRDEVGRHDFDVSLIKDGSERYGDLSGRNNLEQHFEAIGNRLIGLSDKLRPGDLFHRTCPLCDYDGEIEILMRKYCLPIVECGNCGFWYASPVLSPEMESSKYLMSDLADTLHLQFLNSSMYQSTARLRFTYEFQRIEMFSKKGPGRMLDIGCSLGSFLEIASNFGWDVTGVEKNKTTANIARSKGYRVIASEYKSDLFQGEPPFNLVVILDVLEHILNPKNFLADIERVLEEDGLLFIQVPNSKSLAALLRWKKDNIFNGLFHYNYFSSHSLLDMVEASGFDTLHTETILSEVSVMGNFTKKEIKRVLKKLALEHPDQGLTPDFILDNHLGYKVIGVFRKR